jgi:exopolysaccharide biosynthesis polyprenyl glycosylphosphotransferase
LLDVREPPSRRLARLVKRFVDVVVAAVITVVSLPLLALLALAIRLESPGAPLLRQKRVGLNGRIFTCFKFRTMRPDAEAVLPTLAPLNETEGLTFKMRQDPRCTPLGRRIRRWSLDELPQIWNVLLGDMSLVGPRPPLPAEVASYEARHMRRLEVKPGMTGIWQVSGRSNLSFDEMVMMDIFYVDNWSPTLDLRILVRTVIAVLRRHGAY